DQRNLEQAGIDAPCAVILHERAEFVIKTTTHDLLVHAIRNRAPSPCCFRVTCLRCHFCSAVEGHPAHDLGMGEVAAARADFPDPFVGFAPDTFEMFKDGVPIFVMPIDRRDSTLDRFEHCVCDLTIDIEL